MDPTLQYCSCGFTWRPTLYSKIIMLIMGSYSRRCPQCQTYMEFRLINHVVKIGSKPNKDMMEIWKNG